MNKITNYLPDKLFGQDTAYLILWIPSVSIIIILILLFVGLIFPKIENIKTVYDQVNKVNDEINLLNQKRSYLLSLDQEDLQSKSLLVENGVLSEKNSYLLIKIISKMVLNYDYVVGDFSVVLGDVKEIDKKSLKFDYQKVPVEVEMTGPKTKFLEMVSELEKSLPILSIDSFAMTSAGDNATIKMQVSAYYLPDWSQTKLEKLSVSDLTPTKDEQGVLEKIGTYKYYGVTQGQIGKENANFLPSDREDPFN